MTTNTITDPEGGDGGTLRLLHEDESLTSPLLLGSPSGDSNKKNPQQEHAVPSSSYGLLASQTTMESTPQSDGSLYVKVTTMTPHDNGYRDLKIDHYYLPPSAAKAVLASSSSLVKDAGTPPPLPPPEYLSRVEYRVLSPGLELEPPPSSNGDDDDDVSTVYTITHHNGRSSNSSIASSYSARRRKNDITGSRSRWRSGSRAALLISTVCVLFIVLVGAAIVRDYHVVTPGSSGTENDDNNDSSNTDHNTDSNTDNNSDSNSDSSSSKKSTKKIIPYEEDNSSQDNNNMPEGDPPEEDEEEEVPADSNDSPPDDEEEDDPKPESTEYDIIFGEGLI